MDERSRWSARSLIRSPFDASLTVLVSVSDASVIEANFVDDPLYRISFSDGVLAFRVLDEHGLLELWGESWPGCATFRVRNHAWSRESFVTFTTGNDEGWSLVIATGGDCVEVVASDPPEITLERA